MVNTAVTCLTCYDSIFMKHQMSKKNIFFENVCFKWFTNNTEVNMHLMIKNVLVVLYYLFLS